MTMPPLHRSAGAALAAGILWSLAYPPLSLGVLGPPALALVCWAAAAHPWRRRFAVGFAFGLGGWAAMLWWLCLVARYVGAAVLIGDALVLLVLSSYFGLALALYGLYRGPLASALWLAASWTALEFFRGLGILSFTWGSLGHVAADWPFLLRLAAWFGVPGLTLLLAFSAGLLASAAAHYRDRRTLGRLLLAGGGAWIAALLLCLAAPVAPPSASDALRAALIQGNHAQAIKWDLPPEELFDDYARLTRRARHAGSPPELAIWPEVAVTMAYDPDEELVQEVHWLVAESSAALLAGFIVEKYAEDDTAPRYYNCAVLLTPDASGEVSARHYAKQHLLPFAEYVPAARLLPFVNRIVQGAGGGELAPGSRSARWSVGEATFPVAICFESVVPQLVRRMVGKESNLLVVITNDAWFEPGPGPAQHLLQSRFRAVENGVPVLHCGNTGETCLVGADGRVLRRLARRTRDALVVDVPLGAAGGPPYRRWGDVLGWACAAATAAALARLGLTRRGDPASIAGHSESRSEQARP